MLPDGKLTCSTNVSFMHIRTFRAASLQDALEEIRNQMGPEASVLHTRQVRDGWMGWLGRTYVEVTAGLRDFADDPPSVRLESGPTPRDTDSRVVAGQTGPTGQVFSQEANTPQHGLPPQLLWYRDALIEAGVPTPTVSRWLEATASFAVSLGDPIGNDWSEHLKRSVAREMRIGGAIRTQPGDRHVVALVGPTGVGKTTTVAKLAAGFRIEARRRVGLVTIDTFRIAAVQQLKAYAEIMDLPMEVVERPDQMHAALERLGDVDLVLIDTAGRSPRSDARIDQLVELLRTAQPDETHLVLSATSSASTVQSVIKGFAPVRPTAAILTKLDEAPITAGVLSSLVASDDSPGIPLSYMTNGQQVPDDIAIADSDWLLSRLLPARAVMPQIEAA